MLLGQISHDSCHPITYDITHTTIWYLWWAENSHAYKFLQLPGQPPSGYFLSRSTSNPKYPTYKSYPGIFNLDNSHPNNFERTHPDNSHIGPLQPQAIPTRIIPSQTIPTWDNVHQDNFHLGIIRVGVVSRIDIVTQKQISSEDQ